MDDSSVRVAVRIRPRIPRETIDGCQICTTVTPGQPQILMGGNHGFTFDHVLDSDISQEDVFSTVVGLVDGCLDGYNATILAYGQTGSGKTYTMGTGFDTEHVVSSEIASSQGIVPRAVHHLFKEINNKRQDALARNESPPEFTVKAQFVELHNEEINDLISSDLKHCAKAWVASSSIPNASTLPVAESDPNANASEPNSSRSCNDAPIKPSFVNPMVFRQGKSGIKIREDPSGIISMLGIETKVVNSAVETMTCLRNGALVRSTASTNMNDSSSRSHAIFTLHIFQQRIVKPEDRDEDSSAAGAEFETLSAKFHFVDLAGSERLKRTGAVGERAKEGISINSGLLSLGNVISALGDKSKKASHIPYRDSKLTRLLQDSLGGNSRTIMIACISPCDRDFVETLNTLKYANRTRNIKNKVTVNQDKSSRIIASLKQEIIRLEAEVLGYKQGKIAVANGVDTDLYHENTMLTAELEKLRTRVKALQEALDRVTASNAERMAERACDALVTNPDGSDLTQVVRKYILDIEELRTKLVESEAMCDILKRKQSSTVALLNQSLSPRPNVPMTSRPGTAYNDLESTTVESESVTDLITAAQAEIRHHESQRLKLQKKIRKRRTELANVAENENGTSETNGNESPSPEGSFGSSDDGDSGSDGDFEDEEGNEGSMQEEIANINDQINTKQRLIEQLELSNKRALDTKEQYEQQIQILVTKIKHTEEERDRVLTSLKPSPQTTAKVKQVKEEYEAKVSDMQRELTRMKEALKEHNVLVRKNAVTEKQVATLKSEVDTMKKLKVKLQNQMKEENVKFRETDAKRMKEILQLKKDQRKKDVQIRALESKDRLKEQIIKRKLEEVTALKKQNKSGLSRRAAGKVATVTIHKRTSPAKAKKKWDELKSSFTKRNSDRKLLEQLESEMLTHIVNRKQVKEEIEQIKSQIAAGNLASDEINRLNDEIDSLSASVEYSDEQVSHNQRQICELTSGSPKNIEQTPDISIAMDHFTKEDCEYLLQKMYAFTMENVDEFKETATKLSVAEEEIQGLTRELLTANELLSHMFSKYCINDPNLSPDLTLRINNVRASNRSRSGTKLKNGSNHAVDSQMNGQSLGNNDASVEREDASSGAGSYPSSPTSSGRRFVRRQIPVGNNDEALTRKARRLTSSRKELMGDLSLAPASGAIPIVEEDGFVRPGPVEPRAGPLFRSNSTRTVPVSNRRVDRRATFVVHDGGPPTNTDSLNNVTAVPHKVPSTGRKLNPSRSFRGPNASAPTNGVSGNNAEFSHVPTENFNADTTFIVEAATNGSISAPGSPGSTRRNGNENVFQRLTSTTSGVNVEATIQQGSIRGIRERASQKSPFLLTHVADGHAKAVLDVLATEDRLFTSGKDTSVKIWDLTEMREISTLLGPPTNISRIKLAPESRLLFCATACYVRVYDLRTNMCIKTLSSAGTTNVADPPSESYLQLPHKEQIISAIAVCENSSSLYTSYGQVVRLWDLRTSTSLGVITGKHQSQVMCMETDSGRGFNTLVTGSKDHCIKMYSYSSNEPMMNISVSPKTTLSPPHYDGIEAFALNGYTLFSGSRDNCIKKWDLDAKPSLALAYNNAHGSWISGLCLPQSHPQYLVSSSRDGTMKVWNTDKVALVGQVEAHKGGINCLASNKSCIFTGSNVGQVKFWRLNDSVMSLSSSNIFSTQKHSIPNRLLPHARRRTDDIMTMSTGRAYGLEDGTVAFWKLRNLSESSGESSPLGSPDGST